ncbi:MAG TPA: flavodoxin-dependent (E)-4-hydroxy-3-methylbut-2-enyl-diphosphate synthase [Firmicutes bacterium]|nr:flavodoxin-dependent (E)-4-hydroxy-3-methylbut-2-enyl-diphosphate synthase [Bacillota bacterium]
MITRNETKAVRVGTLAIGGGAPVVIQSMTTTKTTDVAATLQQIRELAAAGCELVRVAVPDGAAAAALPDIVAASPLPVVADIHFDYRLALAALDAGVAKLRINPGNIGGRERLAKVVEKAAQKEVPLRIGVNAGSLEKQLLERYGVSPQALVESAVSHIRLVERLHYNKLVISLKASSVPLTVAAHRLLAETVPYPQHLGITEAGPVFSGTIHSAVGIGALLLDGLGDTLRVSLTADPVEEIRVAREILTAAGVRRFGPRIISCPTCGRCRIDLQQLTGEIAAKLAGIGEPLTLAVMGCAVNGPGEAREADLGVAGGKGEGLIFRRGKVVKKVPQEKLVAEFVRMAEELAGSRKAGQD